MTDREDPASGAAPRRSPLHDRHVALDAKFAPFGGWEMPLEYAGGGVLKEHDEWAVIAVQGRDSDPTLEAVGLPVGHDYMSFVEATHDGHRVVVCRTGYTGERGYELVVPAGGAEAVWAAVLAAGGRHDIRPCGLGARDTLRTEMGYPLHGQDISLDITPVQARLGWAVGWSKSSFWGRAALLAERERGPSRVLRGLVAEGRGIARPGMRVVD